MWQTLISGILNYYAQNTSTTNMYNIQHVHIAGTNYEPQQLHGSG